MIRNLNELKARINILEIIRHFTPIKKVANTYKGLCPFHNEKTPSFCVSEQKQIYHCFGCGESGDAFTFLQKFKHLDFNEAVREIAELYNFNLEFDGIKTTPKKDYYEFLARLNQHFKENLLKDSEISNKIRAWLLKRGLNESDLNRFDIGLVEDNFKLREYIGDDLEMALKIGLMVKNQNNELYSQFANRVSFGLRNNIYKIIAFSCRTHPYYNFIKSGKYINSRESFMFHKSEFLYNLCNGRENFHRGEKSPLIVVEGFMDSIALNKFGFKANVASCGTAFNKTHLAQIMRANINDLALCFDKDEAGKKATLKACELLFKHGFFEASVWLLQGKFKDIGEVLEKSVESPEIKPEFDKQNAFYFYVKTTLDDLESAREKDIFLKKLLKSVNLKTNYFLKSFCLKIIEQITGFEVQGKEMVSINKTSFNAEKVLYKSILSDERNKIIAFELLFGSFFENYQESYLKFQKSGEKDEAANALLLDESVKVVKDDDFNALCKSFKKAFLNKELEKAKIAKNYDLIIRLQEKIKAV